MNAVSLARLILLSAIWGGSFLFLRIAAPVLGALPLTEVRIGCGAVFLFVVGRLLHRRVEALKRWKYFLVLGLFNCALPFFMFSYAARTLSASMMSILNATAPLWGSLIAALWLRQLPSARAVVGLVLGVAGVALLVGGDRLSMQPGASAAIAAALVAAFSYAVGTHCAKSASGVDPFANAHGSMWAAVIVVAPAAVLAPLPAVPGIGVAAAALTLGIVCTGVAYLIYFRLVEDLGAASALTVTFLIPLFGVLWGRVFLSEPVRWNTIAGGAIVLVGTALVTNFNPLALMRRSRASPA